MAIEFCDESEDVLRAVLEADWDRGRVRLGILEGKNVSVSRLQIYSHLQIMAIFRRDFELGKSSVAGALEWNVKQIEDTSRECFHRNRQKNQPLKAPLKVRVDPQPRNAAHAEIDGKVTGALSKDLVRKGRKRREPGWLRVVYFLLRPFNLSGRLGGALAPQIQSIKSK